MRHVATTVSSFRKASTRTRDNLEEWLDYNGMRMTYIWDVEIPEGEEMVVESEGKIKAHRVILKKSEVDKPFTPF